MDLLYCTEIHAIVELTFFHFNKKDLWISFYDSISAGFCGKVDLPDPKRCSHLSLYNGACTDPCIAYCMLSYAKLIDQ